MYARIGQIRVVLGNRGKGAVREDREYGAALRIASEWCCVDGVGRGLGGFDIDLVDTGAVSSCRN